MNNRIYISPPSYSDLELELCKQAIQSGWISTSGPFYNSFTQKLETYFGQPVVLTHSGTSAIHLALLLAGVQEGDFVLCSNFTFAASAFPIVYQKATPIFVGIEKETWNVNPEFLEEAIIKSKTKPKAFVLTHVYGMPAPIEEIKSICDQYEIILIEDAAEAMGSTYQNQPLGSVGDLGIISFNGNKIMTTSAGGALIVKTDEQKKSALKWASQSKEQKAFYEHHSVGYNYLMSNILAAIGEAQFHNLEERIEKRREVFTKYQQNFKSYSTVDFQKEHKETFSNRWLSSFVWEKEVKDRIMENLNQNNIESRYAFSPLHLQQVFQGSPYYGDLYELELFQRALSLPSGFDLSEEEQEFIMKIVGNSI